MADLWYSIAKDPIPPPPIGLPTRFYLTASGDGQGTYNLNGNYSGAVTKFKYVATSRYDIHVLLVTVSDSASFGQADYGAIAAGLTNGVTFWLLRPGLPDIQLLVTHAIKSNFEWLSTTPHVALTTFSGSAQTLSVAVDLRDDFGLPLTLFTGWSLELRLNDDLSGLISHTFALRGIKY